MAERRIGIDPLADKYRKLGADKLSMELIKASAENIPFEDEYFDVVCSFNSIDHVKYLDKSAKEITRVLKKGGLFLLIVDVHSMSQLTEPQKIYWNFIEKYFPGLEVLDEKHLKAVSAGKIYRNVRKNIKAENQKKHKGVLTAKLKKK